MSDERIILERDNITTAGELREALECVGDDVPVSDQMGQPLYLAVFATGESGKLSAQIS